MKLTLKPSVLLITTFISLLIGAANYFFFTPHIIFFKWLGIESAKSITINHHGLFLFLKGYFSDIMWCIALCLITVVLNRRNYLHGFDKVLILLTPFMSEAAQYFSLLPGTFDWLDILAYLITIITFNKIFSSSLIPFNMKKIKSHIWAIGVTAIFLLMVFACAPTRTRKTVYHPAPDPCVNHGGLTYSPVLVQINIDGSYTMKDLSGAQRSGQVYFFDALNLVNPGKYKLAEGVTPNLTIYITVNTDSYQHYGAHIKFYVFDDNTWFDMPSNYVDPIHLFDDIAAKLNPWIMYGWRHGDCK
jgi:hypothetical protein